MPSFAAIREHLSERKNGVHAGARWLTSVHDFAEREGLLPVGVETLTRYVLEERPTDLIRALLAAHEIKVDRAVFPQSQPVEPAPEFPGISQEVKDVLTQVSMMAQSRGGKLNRLDPSDVLVALAAHPTSGAILRRLGLTRLAIAYFVSHGRKLPESIEAETTDLTDRSGEIWVRIRNDDYSSMEIVVRVLTEIFGLEAAAAQEAMLVIHRHGETYVGPYPYDVARALLTQATSLARAEGHPLRTMLTRDRGVGWTELWAEARHERLRKLSSKQGVKVGFIARHWRGELALVFAFWGVGVFGTVLLFYGAQWLVPQAMLNLNPATYQRTHLCAGIAIVAIGTWQWTGVWRSAQRHKSGGVRTWLGSCAQVLMLSVVMGAVWLSYRIHGGLRDLLSGVEHAPDYVVTVAEDPQVVLFAGGFRLGATHELKNVLDDNPQVSVVHLASPGGLASEGELMFDLIRERKLATYVDDTCASACTFAYLGGARRYLGPDAELIFHRARLGARSGAIETAFRGSALMRRSGISEEFIRRVANTPGTSEWTPSPDELVASGYVHVIGEPSFAAFD